MLSNRQLSGGLLIFFFQFLIQAGLFFTIPLYLSVALGLSAIDTGIRIIPLSITLLLAAVGIPRLLPNISPRRAVRVGLLAMFGGITWLLVSMDVDAGPAIVTVPLLLTGLGIGTRASQLSSVTVSAVPDDDSPDVGGLQNTATNVGASIGTALAGSLLIAALTASFVNGIEQNPNVPKQVSAQAGVKLAGGIPFISDPDLATALKKAGASAQITEAVMDENETARVDGLRIALSALALISLLGLFFTGPIPVRQPASAKNPHPDHAP